MPCKHNHRSHIPDWVWLAGILLLALALRLLFFVGASIEDDFGFTGYGAYLARGEWHVAGDQSMRRMTYIPIGLAYRYLGGINVFTTHLYHMLCGLMTIAIAFAVGRRLHGFRAGAAAALFLTFVPLHLFYSSRIMPSLPETMWGGLAVWLVLSAEDRLRIGRAGVAVWSYFAAGLLVGMAYLTRETGVVMMGVLGGYLGLEALAAALAPNSGSPQERGRAFGVRYQQGICLVAAFAVVLAAECALHYARTGDAFYRWHMVRSAQVLPNAHWPPWHFYLSQLLNVTDIHVDWRALLHEGAGRLTREVLDRWRAPHYATMGTLGLPILAAATVYAWRRFRGGGRLIVLWFAGYFLFLSFGCSSLSPYVPIRKFERYQILFLTPGAVMVGWAFSRLWVARFGKGVAAALAAALIMSSLYYLRQGYLPNRSYYKGVCELEQMVRRQVDPDVPLYLDGWEKAALEYRDEYRPLYRYQDIASFDGSAPNGAYVVLTKSVSTGQFISDYENQVLRTGPPSSWVRIAEGRLGYWEYFKPGRVPVIFYVPPGQEPEPVGGGS